MDRFKLRETILREIEKPLIPEQRYSVLEFGAEPDSSRIQTEAFQLAIDRVKISDRSDYLEKPGGASPGESGYLDSVCK